MTPEHAVTIIELALYRVSDRMKAVPSDRPVSADLVAATLRLVGEEIAALMKDRPWRPIPLIGVCRHKVPLAQSCPECAAENVVAHGVQP